MLVPALPDDADAVSEWLERLRGSRVEIRVPQRGDKRALMQTVTRNAQQALVLHKTRRASDLTTRSRALEEIQEALELPAAPLRIEAFDVSNLQGTEVVASMVVFEDGLARKSEYRRFVIRGLAEEGKADDTRSIHEVIARRFRRFIDAQEALGPVEVIEPDACLDDAAEPSQGKPTHRTVPPTGSSDAVADVPAGIDPTTGRVKKFAYPPNLVVVDGGAPQVAAARRALDELGIDDVALCGLAKRLEEVWLPGEEDPVILPRTSEGLYLLQRVRDEAHRFAIAHHRERRSKAMTSSALDGIPGLGDVRRKALLRHFGSVKRMREATALELAEVRGHRAPDRGDDRGCARSRAGRPAPYGFGRGEHVDRRDPRRGGSMSEAAEPTGTAGQIVVVSGMSGAGRSAAADVLEDLGWFVIDNLPPGVLPSTLDYMRASGGLEDKIAVVVDVRSRSFFADLNGALAQLRPTTGTSASCSSRPPTTCWSGGTRACAGRTRSRALVACSTGSSESVPSSATCVVTPISSSTRRRATSTSFAPRSSPPSVVRSTGRCGPRSCRSATSTACQSTPTSSWTAGSCPNPHWVDALRPKTGLDEEVRAYVLGQEGAEDFVTAYAGLVSRLAPGFVREGKQYVTIAVGCTGGKHRSVAIAGQLASALADDGLATLVVHRDLGRE